MSRIRTVLFDLDGTLIDTAPDMAKALNLLLAEEGKPTLPYENIRPVVSNGSVGLVKLGFGDNPPELERLKEGHGSPGQLSLHGPGVRAGTGVSLPAMRSQGFIHRSFMGFIPSASEGSSEGTRGAARRRLLSINPGRVDEDTG